MKSSFTGTVLDGSLQLDGRVDLADQSRVHVTVTPLIDAQQRWLQAFSALRELRRECPISSGGVRFTRDELYDRH